MASFLTERAGNDWSVTGTSTANAAVNVTKAAVTGKRHVLRSLSVCGRAAAVAVAGALITVKSGTTLIWTAAISAAAPNYTFLFPDGLLCVVGEALNIDVAAAGASVLTEVSASGLTTV
jgi:hypothetical protein